ncbi:hypothetical protein LY76DRAFT_194018 [Colletotrichum caudatum]|nr:hypothetical protein LY76DRAFT_194018 [Colletotrichum caudatum]
MVSCHGLSREREYLPTMKPGVGVGDFRIFFSFLFFACLLARDLSRGYLPHHTYHGNPIQCHQDFLAWLLSEISLVSQSQARATHSGASDARSCSLAQALEMRRRTYSVRYP